MLEKRVKGALVGAALVLLVGMVLRATEAIDRWVFLVIAAAAVVGPLVVMWLVDRDGGNPGVDNGRDRVGGSGKRP